MFVLFLVLTDKESIIITFITNSISLMIIMTGNLQKPLPRDVKLIIKESFFCGIAEGKPQVMIFREVFQKLQKVQTVYSLPVKIYRAILDETYRGLTDAIFATATAKETQ